MHQIAKAYQNRKTDKNDVIHTPKKIASLMIEMCDIREGQTVLDPCAGSNKVFYNNLPIRSINDYCEITEGIDFFNYNKPIDIIIGNPPYSLWDKWLAKTISLKPIKFAYIFGQLNFTTVRLNKIKSAGYGIVAMHVFKVTHWFGESYCVLFEKGAESIMSLEPSTIMCESCHHRCKRVVPNVCGKISDTGCMK